MIPKKIHYCWLSGDPLPRSIRRCMDTWRRVMPDYELKLWDTRAFDVESVPFVSEAYHKRKWAFAADYIRMHALYTEGGIYLDSDVKVLKPFDDLLDSKFFSSLEYHPTQIERDGAMAMLDAQGRRVRDGYVSGIQIQAAVMGAEAGCPFVADVLSPQIYARVAERYGFIYKDEDQRLRGGITIYASSMFAGNKHEVTPRTRAVHLCAHSWHPSAMEKLKKWLGITKQ